jgi:hypothetical protein
MTEAKPMPAAEIGGTEITRFNALKHGVLSRSRPSSPSVLLISGPQPRS